VIDEELEKMGYIEDNATGFLEQKNTKNNDLNGSIPFNAKDKTQFLKALKNHGNQTKAADDLGISVKILKWHLRKDLKFNEAFHETLLEMRHKIEGELYVAALEGKTREAKLWLEAMFPEEFKRGPVGRAPKGQNSAVDKLYQDSL